MTALLVPRFYADRMDLAIVGELNPAAAVQTAHLIEAARTYYRYAKITVDLMHARVGSRALGILRVALAESTTNGVHIEMRATPRVRTRLHTEDAEHAVRPRRRMGFGR